MLSVILNPNCKGLIGCSVLVSLISKCKCAPPLPPLFPDKAITSSFLICMEFAFG